MGQGGSRDGNAVASKKPSPPPQLHCEDSGKACVAVDGALPPPPSIRELFESLNVLKAQHPVSATEQGDKERVSAIVAQYLAAAKLSTSTPLDRADYQQLVNFEFGSGSGITVAATAIEADARLVYALQDHCDQLVLSGPVIARHPNMRIRLQDNTVVQPIGAVDTLTTPMSDSGAFAGTKLNHLRVVGTIRSGGGGGDAEGVAKLATVGAALELVLASHILRSSITDDNSLPVGTNFRKMVQQRAPDLLLVSANSKQLIVLRLNGTVAYWLGRTFGTHSLGSRIFHCSPDALSSPSERPLTSHPSHGGGGDDVSDDEEPQHQQALQNALIDHNTKTYNDLLL